MSAIEHAEAAQEKLAQLEEMAESRRELLNTLSSSVDLDDLARVVINEGHLFFFTGTIGQLCRTQFEVSVLERAIELQKHRVETCELYAVDERRNALQAKYESVVDDIQKQYQDLLSQLDELRRLDHEADKYFDNATALQVSKESVTLSLPTPQSSPLPQRRAA